MPLKVLVITIVAMTLGLGDTSIVDINLQMVT